MRGPSSGARFPTLAAANLRSPKAIASWARSASTSPNRSGRERSATGVARGARGRGLTTRALRLLSEHAFEDIGLERMQLFADPANHASQRVAERVGYQREGVVRSHLPQRDGTRRDSIAFSLLPGELA